MIKFHIFTFNFLPSLTSNDCIIYVYIALSKKKKTFINTFLLISIFFPLGYTIENNSFYTSLHAAFTPQGQEDSQMTIGASNSKAIEYRFVNLFLDNLPSYYKDSKLQILNIL